MKQGTLNEIEITLHPNATESDRVIVEALCAKYAQNANIRNSETADMLR